MANLRKTAYEEPPEIVMYRIEHGRNCKAASNLHK